MRRHLVIAAAAALLLHPLAASAQGRGEGRWRNEERRAERQYERGGGRWRGEDRRADPRDDRRGPWRDGGRGYDRPPRALPPEAMGPPRGWRRGQYLPPLYRDAPVRDFQRYHLRPPPPGYDWVQIGRDIYLMQRSTGLVLEAIPGGY